MQRIGESRARSVDVRIIAATHRDLASMVADRGFRLDLYQRLAEVELTVPPLRQRRDDIPLLAKSFLATAARHSGSPRQLSPSALVALRGRQWPGNVRELKNCIRRAAYLSTEAEITEAWVQPAASETAAPDLEEGLLDLPLKEAGDMVLDNFRRRYCVQLLSEVGGNITQAAHRAGYSAKGFRELLRRLGLRDDG